MFCLMDVYSKCTDENNVGPFHGVTDKTAKREVG